MESKSRKRKRSSTESTKTKRRKTSKTYKRTEKLRDEQERKQKQKVIKWEENNALIFQFLVNPLDKDQRNQKHPDYDKTSVYIPQRSWLEMTEFEKQYWVVKQDHFDCVVFFRKGKFFEMFEDDARLLHNTFGLKLSKRSHMYSVGIVIEHYDTWAAKLVHLGYKVAKVDQYETPLSRKLSNSKKSVDDASTGLLKRELDMIVTPGTLVDLNLMNDHTPGYLLSIQETDSSHEFAVCLTDTSTAQFRLGYWKDDSQKTKLSTLLFQCKPKELIYPKDGLTKDTIALLKTVLRNPMLNIVNISDMWDTHTTIETINSIFPSHLPNIIEEYRSNSLVVTTLGLSMKYLIDLKVDYIFDLNNFSDYDVLDSKHVENLILDGISLYNLEIFENDVDMGLDGTLFKVMNHCKTPFGKRMIHSWICHPLRDITKINDRLDAVDDLIRESNITEMISDTFSSLTDIERLITRLHSGNLSLMDFLKILESLDTLYELMNIIRENKFVENYKSTRLKNLLTLGEGFPDYGVILKNMFESFDKEKAIVKGFIEPYPGVNEDYDDIKLKISGKEDELLALLNRERKYFNSDKVVYKQIGKRKNLISVPLLVLKRKDAPNHFQLVSKTKSEARFLISDIQQEVESLDLLKQSLQAIESNILLFYIQDFDQHYETWISAIRCVSEIDCLLSNSIVSTVAVHDTLCRPEFIESEDSILNITNMYHPCMVDRMGDSFIPNSISLGGENPKTMVLTGPNMGGKSTLLRQTCICVIMAQIGCYVQAETYVGTPVDRIFTRIGAKDNIFQGKSTFMLELEETSNMLREATPQSLIILDELGRGTSTYDGYAIAYSVLRTLSDFCRTMFSTHYHLLTEELQNDPYISMQHMDAIVDGNEVTFLYKLASGSCPKSYGLKVASMANLPTAVIEVGERKANEFENLSSMKDALKSKEQLNRLFVKLMKLNNQNGLVPLQKHIRAALG
eukprot:TRINITY_DN8395_c0_g1_i2.p1 TRINITY_DN8395_c0_g1~~TRINITY_DN8395_c0_g1_i2.p1  ORF type:complete len:965 (-),score=179.37 TRINITY_DN8395_c0_g1_i2:107-3001(-)